MTGKTTIEWTDQPGYVGAVWNPTTGCTRVSAGCDNCYAFTLHDKRFKANLDAATAIMTPFGPVQKTVVSDARASRGKLHSASLPFPKQYDLPFSQVQLLEERIDAPLRVRKPTCYFVDSMADLFHEDVSDEFLMQVWSTMERATWHRFLILTKRPQLMRERLGDVPPLPNVWLGTSVEDQASADERIPHLLATPAAVRFLSCEPLLGPVDLTRIMQPACDPRDALEGSFFAEDSFWGRLYYERRKHPRIDWVIVGGESGPRARPMDLAWARSLRDQCAAAGVSFFMKQLGSKPVLGHGGEADGRGVGVGPLRETHGRNPDEWPEDLRVRTWPR
jgi:protein gp37